MLRRLLAVSGIALSIVAAVNLFPQPVSAQCGTGPAGSCVSCHLEQDPVHDQGVWHGVHARKDCCTNCHGGNCSAEEKELAHVGIVPNPLEDVYTNCHACHPDDYWQRADVFAVQLQITPASRPTSTPVPTSDPESRQPVIEELQPPGSTPSAPFLEILATLSTGLALIATFFGASYLTHRMSMH